MPQVCEICVNYNIVLLGSIEWTICDVRHFVSNVYISLVDEGL